MKTIQEIENCILRSQHNTNRWNPHNVLMSIWYLKGDGEQELEDILHFPKGNNLEDGDLVEEYKLNADYWVIVKYNGEKANKEHISKISIERDGEEIEYIYYSEYIGVKQVWLNDLW